jgi:hypothetical protein
MKSKKKKTRAEAARLIDNLFENKNPEVLDFLGCSGSGRFLGLGTGRDLSLRTIS